MIDEGCPIWILEEHSKSPQTNIGPIMKSTPSTESEKIINCLQQEVVNIIYQNPVKKYSTEGKVIILKCNKI